MWNSILDGLVASLPGLVIAGLAWAKAHYANKWKPEDVALVENVATAVLNKVGPAVSGNALASAVVASGAKIAAGVVGSKK